MLDYEAIKALARNVGRSVKDLLALSPQNDPFYAGVGSRGEAAEWFGGIWRDHAGTAPHLRRIHYRLVSPPEGVRILLPDGREYQNTEKDWAYLCWASLAARFLDLIPFDGLVDRRNDEALILASNDDPDQVLAVTCETVNKFTYFDKPEFPDLPDLVVSGFDAIQDFILEIWIEKSTQNDWLIPLCERRGVNLVVGIGEQSEIRSRELAMRASEYSAPVRVLYLSDFDPGGRSMPKAVARKVEFAIRKLNLDVDFQLIPVALTPEQCREYNLPRTPIKETEPRKPKFERTFGIGATELDALEALHPGELARIVEEEIDNWLDPDLGRRVRAAESEQELRVRRIVNRVRAQHTEAIDEMSVRFDGIISELKDWEDEADDLWAVIHQEIEDRCPDLSNVEVPRSSARGETDRFVLFDSRRDYLTQMDQYNAWKDGTENDDGEAA